MTNTGLELPSHRELDVLDRLIAALHAAEGSTYEQRLRDLLIEAFTDALCSDVLAADALRVLDQHSYLPARQVCELVLGD